MITPQIPKGFRDFLPDKMIVRQRIISQMIAVFETFGFQPVDTPCIEYAETLEGKYGEDGEKLIYKFQDRGERNVALRYDLTIPLCRLMAMHQNIARPFKRYHIAPVWRADKPQKGRFREFYQCDIDIVGSASSYADGELLVITATVLRELGFSNFVIRVNNRKILNAFAVKEGIAEGDLPSFLRCLDKLDKIGGGGVIDEIVEKNLLERAKAKTIITRLSGEGTDLARIAHAVKGVASGEEGVRELEAVFETLAASDVPESCYQFDFTLARGLDYYTGPIFETVVQEPRIGSITGGGRYDNLIGLYTKEPVPATGTSFGLERLLTVMEELGGGMQQSSRTQVLITLFNTALMSPNLRIAKMLRDKGIHTEVYFIPDKLKKQMTYAANRGIPFVAILGPDEEREGRITLKNMTTGTQLTLPQDTLAENIKNSLTIA